MKSLFFYGTLRHVPLLSIVLGRAPEDLLVAEATLDGHQVLAVVDHPFPTLVSGVGTAKGVLVRGLSDDDIARLNYYEAGFEYALRDIQVDVDGQSAAAQVYFPAPDLWRAGDAWSLEHWVELWGEMSCFAAQEVMEYFGHLDAQQVVRMFPMIRARAQAKVNGLHHNRAHSPSGLDASAVQVLGKQRPYVDFFAIDEYDLTFQRYDGGHSEMVRRAVFLATDAVIVLPYDPVRDRVLLVEQFRPGPFARNDQKPWQLEPIAGRVDAGESPEHTARREAMEEAGLELRDLHDVAHCYASPGCSTEYYDIYVGLADLPDGTAGVAGLASEAEDIQSYLFSFDDLMTMIDDMSAVNAPLVLAGLWLARHRDRLRANA